MDTDRLAGRYRQLQRATVARSALDVIALIFLGAGFAFWGVAFWQLLTPPALLSLLTIQAAVLALVYSLAAPLLLSMLIPTTPAGQLLQKTQWRTIGFPVVIGCAFFLTYQAEYLIEVWLSAQPGVAGASFARPLAISLTIAFVVIPALAWIQLTPERWLAQIQQAHQIKRLTIQQNGELAILKTRLLWAKQKTAVGYANLLPTEQQEVLETMRALFMSIGDTQRSIASSLGISAELERDMMDDREIADHLEYVAEAMQAHEVTLPAVSRRLASDDQAAAIAGEFAAAAAREHRQDAIPVSPPPRSAAAGIAAPPQSAADSGSQPQYAEEHHAARQRLTGIWSSADLGEVIGKSPRAALDRIYAWIHAGLVKRGIDGKGTYYFTESEVR
ncbi:MAG: hypothetical protein M3R61_01465 [Chloroflexota bacterium]|nr:hypothetical protein [Chloroflexota bacterium]